MARRKQVGLLFSYNEEWIAGAYYILNIIHALNRLDRRQKPDLVILSDSKAHFKKVRQETRYPFLKYVEYPFKEKKMNLLKRVLNKISSVLVQKRPFQKQTTVPKIDFLYPLQLKGFPDSLKKVNWMPDFQDHHLPHFFTQEELKERKNYQKTILVTSDIVVFSSEDTKQDFKRLFPLAKTQTFVLPFAVTHPDFSNIRLDELLETYKLPNDYFFLPNQFWAHKNHMVVLEALKILKEKGLALVVAMSGKESDYRNLNNFQSLKAFVELNDLDAYVRFLGFLPRKEQLCLFKNAKAIIQPSLFEGWSTVVEDAKVLNQFVILSDLKVHREQIQKNVVFFSPKSGIALANILEAYLEVDPVIVKMNYDDHVINFGNQFMELVNL